MSNVVSSDPSAFKRIRLKSRLLPLWEYPATRIRPSGWTITSWPRSSPEPTGTMSLPVPATGAKLGASLTAVTVTEAVSFTALKALVPMPGLLTTA